MSRCGERRSPGWTLGRSLEGELTLGPTRQVQVCAQLGMLSSWCVFLSLVLNWQLRTKPGMCRAAAVEMQPVTQSLIHVHTWAAGVQCEVWFSQMTPGPTRPFTLGPSLADGRQPPVSTGDSLAALEDWPRMDTGQPVCCLVLRFGLEKQLLQPFYKQQCHLRSAECECHKRIPCAAHSKECEKVNKKL